MNGAAAAERPDEKEMDLHPSEIPKVTSPQGQRGGAGHAQGLGVHGAAPHHGYAAPRYGEDAYYAVVLNRRNDGVHQGDGGGFHAPLSMGSALLPASSPLVGSAPSPMMQAVDDPERQWLTNQLCGLLIRDAPAALKLHGSPAPRCQERGPGRCPRGARCVLRVQLWGAGFLDPP